MADNVYYVEDWLSGSVPIDDGTGTDWIIIQGTYTRQFAYGASITMFYESPDQIFFSVAVTVGDQSTVYSGGVIGLIENAQGGGGNEIVEGNAVANLIVGDPSDVAGANDTLYGRGANDQLFGMGGSDQLFGGTDNDLLFGDGDPFSQDQGNYLPGNDTLHGDEGNDTAYGGWGDNSLFGDDGYDTLDYSGFFDDFGNAVYRIDAFLNSGMITVFGRDAAGGDEFVVANDSVAGFEAIIGTSGADLIYGRWVFAPSEPQGNEIHGGAGNDSLTGSPGADALYGGAGVDWLDDYDSTLPGLTGVDLLNGGADGDYYNVRDSSTVIVETETGGLDRVATNVSYVLPNWVEYLTISSFAGAANGTGNAVNNQIEGNDSANELTLLGGNDYGIGLGGADVIRGGTGLDSLYGGIDNDRLFGNSQNDLLLGDLGDDSLYGGSENDNLNGGQNNDLLQGGLGRDSLRGGGGRDTFVFVSATESTGRSGRDQIADFTSRSDKIDLSAIADGQSFIGANAFHATGATGLLTGDTNGDGSSDYAIALGIGTVLAGRDLIL